MHTCLYVLCVFKPNAASCDEVKAVWILKHEEAQKRAVPYGIAFISAKQILVPGKEKLQLK